jgi:hypothetical protein
LHSTRTDVERLLGRSSDRCKCIYKTASDVVYVEYVAAPCKGALPGWNVPSSTVLSLTVTSKAPQQFSTLGIDESKFVTTRDHVMTTYHTNRDEGIKYAVTSTGMVESVSYIPSTNDSHLRCSGFPSANESDTKHLRFDFYSDISFHDEKARLDNFAVWLHEHPELIGYIVVYGGRRGGNGEARKRAIRAKSYLVGRRNIHPKRIITTDGGRREHLQVELYALPRDASAPGPVPNVAPKKVTHQRRQQEEQCPFDSARL